MESIPLVIMFDLPRLEDVKEVVVSRQVVEGLTPPLYIYVDRPDRTDRASA
jgi:ATP-dependent Clp protease ATP-binding subunit ClpX